MSARDPSGAGPGPSQGTKGSRDKDKTSGGTASTKARDPSGAGPGPTQAGSVTDHSVAGGSATRTGSGPGGGTTTSPNYTPGAVENHPDANLAAVADMLSSALPGMGLTNTAYKAEKALTDDSDPLSANNMGPIGDAFGGDAGPQKGWQPDRTRDMNGGPQSDTVDDREIPGQAYGAGTQALTGDSEDDSVIGAGTDALFSDVTLADRRKPRPQYGAGTQMVLG